MKLANPTLSVPGRLAWALALGSLSLTACPADDTPADTDTSAATGDSDDDETSATTEESTTTDATESTTTTTATTDATDTDSTTVGPTTTDPSSGSSESTSTGEPPGGLGCSDTPPVCDRGELLGSVQIESADQIDEIAGYTSMTGWLVVTTSDLECLDFLACLETVGHDVTIFGNNFLVDTTGTDAITTVGVSTAGSPPADRDGTVSIAQNNAMTDLNGFNGLIRTQESLSISDNETLTTISGFGGLVGMDRDFTIRFNALLDNIDGLKDILFIGQECVVTNNESLCITDVMEVCGDLKKGPSGGNTANNADC